LVRLFFCPAYCYESPDKLLLRNFDLQLAGLAQPLADEVDELIARLDPTFVDYDVVPVISAALRGCPEIKDILNAVVPLTETPDVIAEAAQLLDGIHAAP
jgi:hypothetical protein